LYKDIDKLKKSTKNIKFWF